MLEPVENHESTARDLMIRAVEAIDAGSLFEAIYEADRIAGVFLRGRKRVSAVIVKLNRTDGKVRT